MIIFRQSEYSRVGSGLKSAIKGGTKGALWGAALAPGNLTTLALGHKKAALGLTAGGALIGAGLGSTIGWKSGTSKWDREWNWEHGGKQFEEELVKRYAKEIRLILDIDKKIKVENDKLYKISSDLHELFNISTIGPEDAFHWSDFFADFSSDGDDSYISINKNLFIKFDKDLDSLALYNGYPVSTFYKDKNKLIEPVRNLKNTIKKYWLDKLLALPLLKDLDSFMYYVEGVFSDELVELDEIGLTSSTIEKYYTELKRFLKTL